MKSKTSFRTATLLLVLFFVSPILTCALVQPTTTTEHACCQKKAPPAAAKPCCTVSSAIQTQPVTLPPIETILGAAVPVRRVDVGPSFGRIDAVFAGTSPFSRRNLLLNFHQLLI
jgi:hypothetical protein